ncbi:MAG TPA: hypothetical protein VFA26_08230 [Gemmataceae bacterium]|nr:hypothetical protein [Gemmataceae bacterium]
MSHVLSLLHEMRGRLGMYVGAPSLTRLAAFLRGYDYAAEKLGQGKPDPFLPDFRDWVHAPFGTTKHSWEDAILLHSADEADAVRHFWQLLDEYLSERRDGSASPVTPAAAPPGQGSVPDAPLGPRVIR